MDKLSAAISAFVFSIAPFVATAEPAERQPEVPVQVGIPVSAPDVVGMMAQQLRVMVEMQQEIMGLQQTDAQILEELRKKNSAGDRNGH